MRIFGVIGSCAVRFRWLVLLGWVAAAVVIPRALPSLSSVTQASNASFLPASAPSEHALALAARAGGSSATPVQVVAATTPPGLFGPLEQAWLSRVRHDLAGLPAVTGVRDLGRSPDGRAAQLEVESSLSGDNGGAGLTVLTGRIRATITRDRPPPDLRVHLAGPVAADVDQQAKSGTTGNRVQLLSVLFIVALLLRQASQPPAGW